MCGCSKSINYSKDVQNAQRVRLWDILLLGPALIIIGLLPVINIPMRAILIGIGAGTIIYNAYFYNKYKK